MAGKRKVLKVKKIVKKAGKKIAKVMSPMGMNMDFEKREDLHTIKRAEEIRSSPKRMKAVKSLAKEEAKILNKISKKGKKNA